MSSHFRKVEGFLLLCALILPMRSSSAQAPASPNRTAPADTTSEPYKQFARFLWLAVATRAPGPGRVDSVYTHGTDLGIDERYTDMRWVAAYRILSIWTAGDSGRAAAVITTVARQTDKGYGWTARYGIRDDTAHWRLERSADTGGRWKVRGDALDGFRVFRVGRDVKWLTGSPKKAFAAVDSIRRARGLPLVR